jgi:hypothetical protein
MQREIFDSGAITQLRREVDVVGVDIDGVDVGRGVGRGDDGRRDAVPAAKFAPTQPSLRLRRLRCAEDGGEVEPCRRSFPGERDRVRDVGNVAGRVGARPRRIS